MRYRQIVKIMQDLKPDIVLEIGTHKAQRPVEWYKAHPFKKYYGFDIFDLGTDELNRKEMNGKGFCNKKYAEQRLKDIPHELIEGNTKETLPKFTFEFLHQENEGIDFAFIDGGHSVDTIKSDWENVKEVMKPGGIVIFDDYYLPERPGFGCNEIVKDLEHIVLPETELGVYLVSTTV